METSSGRALTGVKKGRHVGVGTPLAPLGHTATAAGNTDHTKRLV